jgi:glycosyltransferase involved in cell wall biosynthesis
VEVSEKNIDSVKEEMNPILSIITPCYNHGSYLDDCVQSVALEKHISKVEHIIVNDGSTDGATIEKLRSLQASGYHVIHQENRGLAAARNAAMAAAKGKYILPLDSDNKIIPEVMLKAVTLMERNGDVAVVYTNARRFGDVNGEWIVGRFDPAVMLYCNSIDACAVIRREVLEKLGGYDEKMPVMGYEDWELWMRIFFSGGKFHYLEETGFYYRVLADSMVRTISVTKLDDTRQYIFRKNMASTQVICDAYKTVFDEKLKLKFMDSYLKKYKLRSIVKILIGRPFYY